MNRYLLGLLSVLFFGMSHLAALSNTKSHSPNVDRRPMAVDQDYVLQQQIVPREISCKKCLDWWYYWFNGQKKISCEFCRKLEKRFVSEFGTPWV